MMRLPEGKAGRLYRVSNPGTIFDSKSMKRLISMIKWPLGAMVVLVQVVMLVNLPDEALDPAVKALLASPSPEAVADKGVPSFEPRGLVGRSKDSQRMAGRQLKIPVCSSNSVC